MKKSLRNTLTGAVLAGTLSGCGLFGSEASFADPGDKAFIQKTFDETAAFWGKNGIGIANGAKLIMLSEAETYVCDAEKPITSGSDTFYYCGNDQAIIVPAEATNDMHDMGMFKEDVKAGLRHELGHVVQSGTPNVKQETSVGNEELFSELQATCYAGALTITIDAESVAEIREHFQRARTSSDHGTGAQQAAAYDQGVAQAAAKGPFEACATVPGLN